MKGWEAAPRRTGDRARWRAIVYLGTVCGLVLLGAAPVKAQQIDKV